MSPKDIFWLAQYAHRVLSLYMPPAHRFTLTLQFGGKYPGLDIWVYNEDTESTLRLPYELACTTRGQVDALVEKVKSLASIPA